MSFIKALAAVALVIQTLVAPAWAGDRPVLETTPWQPGPHARLAEDGALEPVRPGQLQSEPVLTPQERKWVANAKRTDPTGGGNDVVLADSGDAVLSAHVAIASNGDVFVALRRGFNETDDPSIEVLRSTDGGDVFQLWGSLGVGDGATQDLFDLEIAEGDVDRVYVGYRSLSPAVPANSIAWSDLAAPTAVWNTRVIFDDPTIGYSFAGDLATDVTSFSSFYIYAVTSGRDGNGDDIWFSRSTDFGDTWETPYRIAELNGDPNIHYRSPSLSYGFGGNLHVVWQMDENFFDTFDDAIRYRRATNFATGGISAWDPGPIEITPTNDGNESRALDVEASTTDGTVLILYQDRFNIPQLICRSSTDAGVTWPTSESVDTTLELRGDLQYRASTNEFIVSGQSFSEFNPTSYYDRVFRVSAAATPLSFGPLQILSDRSHFGFISLESRIALDPSRSERVGLVWSSWQENSFLTAGFDAEWRGDPGFPHLEFVFDLDVSNVSGNDSPPAVVDLDADGLLEIVFADADGRVRVVGHDGVEKPGWPQSVGFSPGAVAIGDLNGDGNPAIVAGTDAGEVYAFEPDGTLMHGFPLNLSTGADTYVAIGAVGGPYPRGIVVTSNTRLFVVSYRGEVISPSWNFTDVFTSAAAIGDINDDGVAEIVTAKGSFLHAHILSSGLNQLSLNFPGKTFTNTPSLGDLDLNGDLEIVLPTEEGDVFVVNHDGTAYPGAWPFSAPVLGPVSNVALAQFLGPTEPDLAFHQTEATIHVFFEDGVEQSAYPRSTTPGSLLLSGPTVDQVNRTSSNVIVPGGDDLLWSYQNTGGLPADWPKEVGKSLNAAASGDIDLDGDNEIVVLTRTQLVAIDVNHPPEPLPQNRWPMFGYDPQRTACLNCTEDVVTSTLPVQAASRVSFAVPSPNPSPGTVFFQYSLPTQASVRLEIFDARGRRVRDVIRREEAAGSKSVHFDGRDRRGLPLSSGQYYASLTIRGPGLNETLQRKFTLMR